MPITKDDIKLLESERMTDNEDGGGRVTGNVILDGKSNNIFPDISELDRIYGRVNLRKVYPGIYTLDQDSYYGTLLILDEVPQDDHVDALIFDTADWNDTRADAKNRIEAYVVRGPVGPWFLYERQLVGQQTILLQAPLSAPLPEVGDVVYLVQHEDTGSEFSQYCRITRVGERVETFNIGGECRTFQRKIITLGIGHPLRHTFEGAPISCYDDLSPPAKIRTTQVADAAKYYGTVALRSPAAPGDITVEVDGVHAAIVPSTRGETPITDKQPGGRSAFVISSGGERFNIVGPANTGGIEVTLGNRATTYTYRCVPIPAPGALVVEYRSLGRWYSIRDDGTGALVGDGSGRVDFNTGSVQITLLALPDVGSEVLFTWSSGAHYTDRAGTVDYEAPRIQHALGVAIEPGSLVVKWLEDGQLKSATADISGAIAVDGLSGSVTNGTGEVFLEFERLPDQNSKLRFEYNELATVREVLTGVNPSGGWVAFTTNDLPKAGTLRIEWEVSRGETTGAKGSIYTKTVRAVWNGSSFDKTSHTYLSGTFQKSSQYKDEVRYVACDAGNGYIAGDAADHIGTIDYATGDVALKVENDYEKKIYSDDSGQWTGKLITESFESGILTIDYVKQSASPITRVQEIDIPPLQFALLPLLQDEIVPGTLRLSIGGARYSDRAGLGSLYLDDGTIAGSVDYETGIVQIDIRPPGLPSVTIDSMISVFGMWSTYEFRYRTAGSPLQPGSLTQSGTAKDGTLITATTDLNGVISEPLAEGSVNQEQGVVRMRYGRLVQDSDLTPAEKNEDWYDPSNIDEDGFIWKPTFVYPNTVRYNCVIYTYLPLDADVLGLDPVRLPSDGRVPIFRPGDVVVIHNTQEIIEAHPADGQVIDCGRVRLERVTITDADGVEVTYMDTHWTRVEQPANGLTIDLGRSNLHDVAIRDDYGDWVDPAHYTADLAAGTVTLDKVDPYQAPLQIRDRITDYTVDLDAGKVTLTNIGGYAAPLTIAHRIADKALVSDVQIDGRLTLTAQITHDFPAGTSRVSSALIIGDLASRWTRLFEQSTWTGEWSDERIGDEPLASYDAVTYPLEVDNRGCIQERWAIIFTGATTFKLVGEHVGQIALGDTNNDFAPINPNVGRPYFTIRALGWGSGWATGNVLRFNTVAANHPVWLARCIQQGEATAQDDHFCIGILGDVDS